MNNPGIIICQDREDLSRRVATEFVQLAHQSIAARGRFAVTLSGGSTPKGLYALLATPEFRVQVPWSKVHLFWGDERCVAPDHRDSNYRLVYDSLISVAPVPVENVHRMRGEIEPELAASEYERALRRFFELAPGELPRFDLILLGLGEDGHTASLFPGSAALDETRRLVSEVYTASTDMHRLTLTLPVLNGSGNILFLIAGAAKASILREVLDAPGEGRALPAQRVRPTAGRLVWFADRAAATGL